MCVGVQNQRLNIHFRLCFLIASALLLRVLKTSTVLSHFILVLPARQTLSYLSHPVLVRVNVHGFPQAHSKTAHPAAPLAFFISQLLRQKGPTGVDPVCDSTVGEVRSSAEGDQSELSLKGCQARRNPIQYQYRSTAGRPGELLGPAVASLTVVSAAAACQRPHPPPRIPLYPPTVPNTGQDRQMGCLGSLPRDHSEGDEYQPVEEETASRPWWTDDVFCARPFRRRRLVLFVWPPVVFCLADSPPRDNRSGQLCFLFQIKAKYKPFG